MSEHFRYWKAALASEKQPTFLNEPQPGFYRLRKKDRATNEVWWTPVAYFMDGGKLVGVVGDRNMNEREVGDIWTFVCQYPIPEETFFAFEDRVEVPNADWPAGLLGEPKRPPFANAAPRNEASAQQVADWIERKEIPAADREVMASDNLPPPERPLSLVEQHKEAIEAAIGAAPKAVPTTAAECALAEGSKNRIAELRLAAARDGKAAYEPLYRAYTAEQKQWSPLVAAAETEEKALGRLVLTFKENERKRVIAEQAAADAKQREIDEANARAADRAIAAGKPEPAPVVVETVVAAAPEPVKPTYGTRSVKAELKTILDEITDQDAVYAYFKGTDAVKAVLTTLAKAAITAGRTVPGTKTREGLI